MHEDAGASSGLVRGVVRDDSTESVTAVGWHHRFRTGPIACHHAIIDDLVVVNGTRIVDAEMVRGASQPWQTQAARFRERSKGLRKGKNTDRRASIPFPLLFDATRSTACMLADAPREAVTSQRNGDGWCEGLPRSFWRVTLKAPKRSDGGLRIRREAKKHLAALSGQSGCEGRWNRGRLSSGAHGQNEAKGSDEGFQGFNDTARADHRAAGSAADTAWGAASAPEGSAHHARATRRLE